MINYANNVLKIPLNVQNVLLITLIYSKIHAYKFAKMAIMLITYHIHVTNVVSNAINVKIAQLNVPNVTLLYFIFHPKAPAKLHALLNFTTHKANNAYNVIFNAKNASAPPPTNAFSAPRDIFCYKKPPHVYLYALWSIIRTK